MVSVIPGPILALSLLPCAHWAASGFHRLRTVMVEGVVNARVGLTLLVQLVELGKQMSQLILCLVRHFFFF